VARQPLERVRHSNAGWDMETQAQILSRHQEEIEQGGYEDFDPLEDGPFYLAAAKQLSRSLFESQTSEFART